jgi:cell division septum initiation protein DivIVA
MRPEKSGCYGNEPPPVDYYASRTHGGASPQPMPEAAVAPQLAAELKRVMEGQDELRKMIVQLATQRSSSAWMDTDIDAGTTFNVSTLEEQEGACTCGGEAAVGRAMVRAQHYSDHLRRAAEQQAQAIVAEARVEALAIRDEAVAYREEADREIQALAGAASEARQRLLEEARTRVEVVHAAELAMQRRLAELTAEVKRAEKRLESLSRQSNNFDTELVSRVRKLIHFTEPGTDPEAAAANEGVAVMNSAALSPA